VDRPFTGARDRRSASV